MSNDLDLSLAGLADLDGIAEVSGAAVHLDAVVEELLEGGHVEDLVRGGLRSIDDELLNTSTTISTLRVVARVISSSGVYIAYLLSNLASLLRSGGLGGLGWGFLQFFREGNT